MHDGKIAAQRTWGASPTGWTSALGFAPGTREFFEAAVAFRDQIEQPWLTNVIPFRSFAGKRVLEIGTGPGYDALKLMQEGADYKGIDITPENIERTLKHLSYFGLRPDVKQGDAESLQFEENSFDVVYSNGVLHHVPDIEKAFSEVWRVLKSGGDFYCIVYNKESIFYLFSVILPFFVKGEFLHTSLAQRRSRIECSTAHAAPIVNVYSRNSLRKILRNARFDIASISTRKCTPEDLPAASKIGALYRKIPGNVFDALGNAVGWYLIAHASKP